jgi:D-threo-aldose 1-dehydrogenase
LAGLEAGIAYLDTAPFYGLGRAEHLVGQVLREYRRNLVISSKAGRLLRPYRGVDGAREGWAEPLPFTPVYDYSHEGIMRSFEDSLQRLGRATIDILYVHDIGTMVHGETRGDIYWRQLIDGGYRAMCDLKDSGAVKAIGLGVNEWEVLIEALALGDWDVFLLAGRYTLLEQTAFEPLLSSCLKRGVSLVCGSPFNGGALMGTGTWNYAKAPESVIARVRALESVCAEFEVPLGAAALQFPMAHPSVCSVLPGPRSPLELSDILSWWRTSIPQEFWSTLSDRGIVADGAPVPGAVQL